MVEVRRIRAPEVPLARFVIALFTLLVVGGIYYVAGGPIPYFISWDGPAGAAFQGRYAVFSASDSGSWVREEQFRGTYPRTLTLWASRRQGVAASAQNSDEGNALNAIVVRRGGVVCTQVHTWGTAVDAVCPAP